MRRHAEFFDVESAKRAGYTATKLLPMPTWAEVVRSAEGTAGFAVVQVGLKKEDFIPGVTHDLRGLTSISEVGLIIKHGECHIDTEGGLVHLARAVNRRSVVMFGPTPAAVFGYDQNINLSSSSCTDCWWITNDWFGKCPRGTVGPRVHGRALPGRDSGCRACRHLDGVRSDDGTSGSAAFHDRRDASPGAATERDLYGVRPAVQWAVRPCAAAVDGHLCPRLEELGISVHPERDP